MSEGKPKGDGTWKYLPTGVVVHWVERDRTVAPCGKSPDWFDPSGWRGTGTQAEYERAASLPICKSCVKLVY